VGDIVMSFITSVLNAIFGTGTLNAGKDAIITYAFNGDILGGFTDVNAFILPVASVLVCIYFVIELMDKLTHENFSTDQFIVLMIKLVFSILIVENAAEIASYIMSFGEVFTSGIATSSAADIQASTVEKFGFFEAIVAFVLMIIPFLFSLIIQLIMYFFVFGYALEVNVRSIMAPIGFADLISGGSNSNGMRYLKKLLALSIQGGLMILILGVGSAFCILVVDGGANVNDFHAILDLIIPGYGAIKTIQALGIQLATVGLLGSAKTIANDLIG